MITIPVIAADNSQLLSMIRWCYDEVCETNLIWDWDFGRDYPHDSLSVVFSFERKKDATMFALRWANLATQN